MSLKMNSGGSLHLVMGLPCIRGWTQWFEARESRIQAEFDPGEGFPAQLPQE